MPRRLTHGLLALALALSSEVWAIGLGDISLDSALNEPLRAQIALLSATPEELDELQITLASQSTFERYGLDRPVYLQDIAFEIVRSGRSDGNFVRATSTAPMTEPFLTFLVEASWSRGRLLREYTVLLDPPTFAPRAARQAPSRVAAPQRSTQADSGRIEPAPAPAAPPPVSRPRPAPPQAEPAPPKAESAPPKAESAPPKAEPVRDDTPYDTASAGDYVVRRGDSLWGIASANRPDSRLTMNQTMLAIYDANPQAFGGNINLLRAGARLRIPSADEIYRIDRGDATSEVKRQYSAWDQAPGAAPAPAAEPRPRLTLVPPDDDVVGLGSREQVEIEPETEIEDAATVRERAILDRIADLEAADVPQQRSLIQIRDNEIAALREELASLRGEVYEPVGETFDADGPFVEDETEAAAMPEDDLAAEADEPPAVEADAEADAEAAAEEAAVPPTTTVTRVRIEEPSLIERIAGWATNVWALVGAALLVAAGILFWFMRRRGEEAEGWGTPLDHDEVRGGAEDAHARTETISAPTREDESFVVVEQDAAVRVPADVVPVEAAPSMDATAESGEFASIEDTFSSDTAINLDQSDPIAEADFHMAYGLYDQAADLVNGALEVEPERQDLLTKLCEIYFVWGNRDAFVDAAERLRELSGGDSGDWDKIVIMGQQIAADNALFAGAGVSAMTREVDLSLASETDAGETGILDMDFGTTGGDGAADPGADDEGLDFVFGDGSAADAAAADFNATNEMPTMEQPATDPTAEMPTAEPTVEARTIDETTEQTIETAAADETAEIASPEATIESPTIEEQFSSLDGTAELPTIPDSVEEAIRSSGQASDQTAEIDLDDLGLDLSGFGDDGIAALDDDQEELTEIASLDDLDSTGTREALFDSIDSTAERPALDLDKTSEARTVDSDSTSEHRALDPDSTSEHRALDPESTSEHRALDPDSTGETPALDPDSTGETPALDPDATSERPALDIDASGVLRGLEIDETSESGMRLAADETGHNPLLDTADVGDEEPDASLLDATGQTRVLSEEEALAAVTGEYPSLGPDDATYVAPSIGRKGDFEFAQTEALPPDSYRSRDPGATGELPSIGATDVDLDLDDLTAALEVSEFAGDAVRPRGDDATVEQLRPGAAEADIGETQELSPEDLSDDLHEARTMTEVGTKLDLARAYVDMGDPAGARSILEEVLDEGDEGQRQQAQQLLNTLPS